jgi:uncharacterized protein with ATP-grasp and redox domains
MATWGNLIDVAQDRPLPGPGYVRDLCGSDLAVDDRTGFLDMLGADGRLLILGDNAGETVFDRLLLELLPPGVEAVYAVRPEPVLNDATLDDALHAGIDLHARIIDTGLDAPTVSPGMTGRVFAEEFGRASVILSKGQGNLEGLFGTRDRRLFYSFVVKCDVIAGLSGRATGSAIFVNSMNLPGGAR